MIVIKDKKGVRHILGGGETISAVSVFIEGEGFHRIQLKKDSDNPMGKAHPLFTTHNSEWCDALLGQIDKRIEAGGNGGVVFIDINREIDSLIGQIAAEGEGEGEERGGGQAG